MCVCVCVCVRLCMEREVVDRQIVLFVKKNFAFVIKWSEKRLTDKKKKQKESFLAISSKVIFLLSSDT